VLIRLQESSVPGDAERGVNRAINFVQADRFRQYLERLLRALFSMSDEELNAFCFGADVDKSGNTTHRMHTRPFADLASALEKAHAMTYAALSDTATDRKARHEDADTENTAGELHIVMANAMAQIRSGNSNATALEASQRLMASGSQTSTPQPPKDENV
jgi:hypothetical protein